MREAAAEADHVEETSSRQTLQEEQQCHLGTSDFVALHAPCEQIEINKIVLFVLLR